MGVFCQLLNSSYQKLKIGNHWFGFAFGFILIMLSINMQAQINYPGKPVGPGYDGNKKVVYYKLAVLQSKMLNINNQENTTIHLKVDNFGEIQDVNLSPLTYGTWDSLPNQTILWRIGITSNKASSLSLIFNSFHLEPGCKLMVYSPSLNDILGAFTYRNNRENNIFAVSPVYGDSLIIELQLQSGLKDFGQLELRQIGVGNPISERVKSTTSNWYRSSDTCEVDVRCLDRPEIQNQKHSVCRIVIGGKRRCTGTLVNNTSSNGLPYVLTAGHCITNDVDAATSVFFFDYESPYCYGPDGPVKSLSGSKLISRDSGLDFALLKITEAPPLDYNPLFSGWDATGESFDHSYTYHHPQGDVKKITENRNLVLDADYNTVGFDHNVHWLVQIYDTGTTEPGSSGSALFDSSYRVRGTLTGGSPGCSYEIDDYYEKIGHSWNDRSEINQQLKHWLDPLNLNTLKCDNYDPAINLTKNGVLLSNIDSIEELQSGIMTAGWGFASGYNNYKTVEYAEHFYKNGTKYIYALDVNIGHNNARNVYTKIIFKVWSGNKYPEDIVFSKEFLLFELNQGEVNFIRLDSAVKVNDNFFVGYEIFYPFPMDSFSVQIAAPRGTNGLNTAFVKSRGVWTQLTDGKTLLNTSLDIKPLVYDFMPSKNSDKWKLPFDPLTIYPIPAKDILQVLLNEKHEGSITLTAYDMFGRTIITQSYTSPEPNMEFNISSLVAGFYILKVEYPGISINKKFVKL